MKPLWGSLVVFRSGLLFVIRGCCIIDGGRAWPFNAGSGASCVYYVFNLMSHLNQRKRKGVFVLLSWHTTRSPGSPRSDHSKQAVTSDR